MRGPAKLLATTLVLLLAGRAAAAPDGDGCRAPTPQLYSNLSCPFEWGKYSCYHQGRIQQARASYEHASRHISNRSRGPCEYKGLPKNIVLVGDSTMRQVFVALGCGLLPVLSGRFVGRHAARQRLQRRLSAVVGTAAQPLLFDQIGRPLRRIDPTRASVSIMLARSTFRI